MLSIVIPIFNQEKNLTKVIPKIYQTLKNENLSFEIIAINDGSTDNTLKKLSQFKNNYLNLKIIHLKKNQGQHSAIFWGMYFAQGEIIITFDCDFEIYPKEIIRLLKLKNNYHLVNAKRTNRNIILSRKIYSFIFNHLFYFLTKIPLSDYGSPLKIWDKKIVKEILKWGNIPAAISTFNNFKILEVKVKSHPNKKSSYNFIKLLFLGLNFLKLYYFPVPQKNNFKNIVILK